MWIFFAVFSGYWVLRGLNAVRNAEYIAQSNADYIASGREEFFEQRRSWRAWKTTPLTDAMAVEQAGRKKLIWGFLGLFVVTPLIFWIERI
ncbi:hypothetical protein [Parasphingorhabdus sp.]|uniref:hypothetical protein n=1 Tax=Parasphingorhabdus sp. TaxID=2709688 RepID=UPI0032665F6E